ncbi:hypothetical protein [Nocardia sp. NPDC046763]|uniref:hypothetical protein n=1 Tax=Nocardia sp. NPDC046763 TaxID=3155256 RepID=UPI0033DE8329
MTQAPITVDRWELQRAVDSAVSDFMNALATDAPPLQWRMPVDPHDSQLSGMAHSVHHADPAAVAAQWAALLGLENEEISGPFRIFHGRISGLPVKRVEVWCETEQAQAEASVGKGVAE